MNNPRNIHLKQWLSSAIEALGQQYNLIKRDQAPDPLTQLRALLDEISFLDYQPLPYEEINAMAPKLARVVADALQGEDIRESHPAFYRKMLRHPDLMEAFLDMLVALEPPAVEIEQVEYPEALFDLSFLNAQENKPSAHMSKSGWLTLVWRLDLNELIDQFRLGWTHEHAYRRTGFNLEAQKRIAILEDHVQLEHIVVDLKLEIILDVEKGEVIQPQLTIRDKRLDHTDIGLETTLHWSPIHETVPVNPSGLATFSVYPIESLFDNQMRPMTPLSLTLRQTS